MSATWDGLEIQSAILKGAPNPKHHSQVLWSAIKSEWIESQTSEMNGLWRRGVFQEILRSLLTPQDRVFTSLFQYKTKLKGGEFDKCKLRLQYCSGTW